MVAKTEKAPNLAVVDEAFGPGSDLYLDVLQVQPNAGTGQIQDAYFDRRNELFQLLADIDGDNEQDSITESHRRSAERKMDAVVCSVRILGDPDLRLQYDDMRAERLKANKSPKRKPRRQSKRNPVDEDRPSDEAHDLRQPYSSQSSQGSDYSPGRYAANSPVKSSRKNDRSFTHVTQPVYTQSPKSHQSLSRKNIRTVSPEIQVRRLQDKGRATRTPPQRTLPKRLSKAESAIEPVDETETNTLGSETVTMASDDEDETFFTYDDGSIDESIIRKTLHKPRGFLDRIRIEAIGACDDTSRSFDQVCSAFTLQEADIKAVMGRIDKASRQLQEVAIIPERASRKSASSRSASRNRRHATANAGGRRSPIGRKLPSGGRRSKSVPRR